MTVVCPRAQASGFWLCAKPTRRYRPLLAIAPETRSVVGGQAVILPHSDARGEGDVGGSYGVEVADFHSALSFVVANELVERMRYLELSIVGVVAEYPVRAIRGALPTNDACVSVRYRTVTCSRCSDDDGARGRVRRLSEVFVCLEVVQECWGVGDDGEVYLRKSITEND